MLSLPAATFVLIAFCASVWIIVHAMLGRRVLPRRQSRHDPRDDIAQGDDIYLAREVRFAIHPEAEGNGLHPPFRRCAPGCGCVGNSHRQPN